MKNQSDQPRAWIAALALFGGIILVFVLGALTTVLLVPWLERAAEPVREFFLRKGPHRLMGRVTLVWLLLYLPFLLKAIGWRGWRDIGWSGPEDNNPLGDFLTGFALGVLTLIAIAFVMILAGTRAVAAPESIGVFVGQIATFTLSCLVVSLLEETVARGIFFRCFSRCWNAPVAALTISLLFGLLHFARPLEESFTGGPLLSQTWSVLASIPDHFVQTHNVGIRVLNLTVFSLVLCALVGRTGTIWLAAGLHAGFVWIKHINGEITDSVRDPGAWAWLGHKADAVDSPAGTVVLLLLLASVLIVPALQKRRT